MLIDVDFWRDKRVFLTGHTGFKGAWLAAWLDMLGAEVFGYARAPEYTPSVYESVAIGERIAEHIADIRDADSLSRCVEEFQPQVIFHLAAQPLVKYSYQNPLETFETNIMGTAHMLQATRSCNHLEAVVVVTTDKCYLNQESQAGYAEDQPLGGYDPYSSSKACADLLTSSWYQSYVQKPLTGNGSGFGVGTARAGNVIGGGDMAQDRLIPDVLRALAHGKQLDIRSPGALRPWQYVLDPLAGYLRLAQLLAAEPGRYSGAWNFGPARRDVMPVAHVVEALLKGLDSNVLWSHTPEPHTHETQCLLLDCTKAKSKLGWLPKYRLSEAIDAIVRWERCAAEGTSRRELVASEITGYMNRVASD